MVKYITTDFFTVNFVVKVKLYWMDLIDKPEFESLVGGESKPTKKKATGLEVDYI